MILIALLFSASVVFASNEKILVCYYGTWATYRWGSGQMSVENINPELCTHLVYTFVGIDAQGTVISLDPYLDLPDNSGRDNFRKFTALKNSNPKLKIILAVGGWNEGSAKYSIMTANPTYRQNFIQSALKMVQEYNFDGFDVDWEYPNRRDTVHGTADIDNFTQLLRELKEEFDKHDLLVTVAVSSVEAMASLSYNVAEISKYVDYISIMTYDMYGAWDPVTGHNSPLHKGEGDEGKDANSLYTVDMSIKYWLKSGCPPEKLIVGLPFYGRTFTLTDANDNHVRSPSRGEGIAGKYTATNGFIGYNELCIRLQTETWTVRNDEKAKVPYAVKGTDWVSFDNPKSLAEKVEYALSFNLGGIMVWSVETDDFHGQCGDGDFPLLRTINKAMSAAIGSTTPASSSTSTPVPSSSLNPLVTTPSPSTTSIVESSTTIENSSPSLSSSTQSPSTSTSKWSSSSTTSTPNPTTSASGSSSSTTNAPSSSTTASSSVSICTEEGFMYNPSDCSTYYMCVQQPDYSLLAVKFSCPLTLHWDRNNLNCNYPQYVECKV